jgi:uncharacterized protein
MQIVLDTNLLLVSVSAKSQSHWLYDAFIKGKYELSFTTEILAEYEEQFSQHWSPQAAEAVVASLLELPNAVACTVYFHLNLITADKDDNKFVDCAFASNATYLVTEDAHFNVLKNIEFPYIRGVSLKEFKQILLDRN